LTFDSVLTRTADETFGELAFMLVMPRIEGEPDPPPAEWGHAVRLEFDGPFGGEIRMAITAEMLNPLAENMLGLDLGEKPPEGVMLEDALKELLNVVCGNVLPAIAGKEAVFNIGGPVLIDPADLDQPEGSRELVGQTELMLDSGRTSILLFVDDTAQLQPFASHDE
jgi:hypothetical protein